MSQGLLSVLGPVLGSVAGAGLGELGGDALGISSGLAEAVGGGLGGLGGALLTGGGTTADILGGIGGALGGPALLGGAESLFGGTLSNALLGGTGAGYGASAVSPTLGGVSPMAAPAGGLSAGSGGASAAAVGGGDLSVDPNAVASGPPGTAFTGNIDYGSMGTTGQVLNPTGGSNLGSFLSQNKSWLLPAAGIGAAALLGNQPVPAQGQLTGLANQEAGLAGQYSSALNTGTLPPGAQAAVSQALQSAEANVRSTFANMGLTGSTMEAEALNSAREQSAAQTFDILNSVTQTGLQAAGVAGNIDSQLMQTELAQDQELSNAIAQFAASFGGGGAGQEFVLKPYNQYGTT